MESFGSSIYAYHQKEKPEKSHFIMRAGMGTLDGPLSFSQCNTENTHAASILTSTEKDAVFELGGEEKERKPLTGDRYFEPRGTCSPPLSRCIFSNSFSEKLASNEGKPNRSEKNDSVDLRKSPSLKRLDSPEVVARPNSSERFHSILENPLVDRVSVNTSNSATPQPYYFLTENCTNNGGLAFLADERDDMIFRSSKERVREWRSNRLIAESNDPFYALEPGSSIPFGFKNHDAASRRAQVDGELIITSTKKSCGAYEAEEESHLVREFSAMKNASVRRRLFHRWVSKFCLKLLHFSPVAGDQNRKDSLMSIEDREDGKGNGENTETGDAVPSKKQFSASGGKKLKVYNKKPALPLCSSHSRSSRSESHLSNSNSEMYEGDPRPCDNHSSFPEKCHSTCRSQKTEGVTCTGAHEQLTHYKLMFKPKDSSERKCSCTENQDAHSYSTPREIIWNSLPSVKLAEHVKEELLKRRKTGKRSKADFRDSSDDNFHDVYPLRSRGGSQRHKVGKLGMKGLTESFALDSPCTNSAGQILYKDPEVQVLLRSSSTTTRKRLKKIFFAGVDGEVNKENASTKAGTVCGIGALRRNKMGKWQRRKFALLSRGLLGKGERLLKEKRKPRSRFFPNSSQAKNFPSVYHTLENLKAVLKRPVSGTDEEIEKDRISLYTSDRESSTSIASLSESFKNGISVVQNSCGLHSNLHFATLGGNAVVHPYYLNFSSLLSGGENQKSFVAPYAALLQNEEGKSKNEARAKPFKTVEMAEMNADSTFNPNKEESRIILSPTRLSLRNFSEKLSTLNDNRVPSISIKESEQYGSDGAFPCTLCNKNTKKNVHTVEAGVQCTLHFDRGTQKSGVHDSISRVGSSVAISEELDPAYNAFTEPLPQQRIFAKNTEREWRHREEALQKRKRAALRAAYRLLKKDREKEYLWSTLSSQIRPESNDSDFDERTRWKYHSFTKSTKDLKQDDSVQRKTSCTVFRGVPGKLYRCDENGNFNPIDEVDYSEIIRSSHTAGKNSSTPSLYYVTSNAQDVALREDVGHHNCRFHRESVGSRPSRKNPSQPTALRGSRKSFPAVSTNCSRLNPYCQVCRERFSLVLVNEQMEPVHYFPHEESHRESCKVKHSRKELHTAAFATSVKLERRRRSPVAFRRLGPYLFMEREKQGRC